jgi:hypothetical protein
MNSSFIPYETYTLQTKLSASEVWNRIDCLSGTGIPPTPLVEQRIISFQQALPHYICTKKEEQFTFQRPSETGSVEGETKKYLVFTGTVSATRDTQIHIRVRERTYNYILFGIWIVLGLCGLTKPFWTNRPDRISFSESFLWVAVILIILVIMTRSFKKQTTLIRENLIRIFEATS